MARRTGSTNNHPSRKAPLLDHALAGQAITNGAATVPRLSRQSQGPADSRMRPIGVFDSGIGGLTVLQELISILPSEDFIYLGDTARLPYGTKSNEVITRYSRENTEFLLAKGIKLLVVACNTSSAVALGEISRETMVPVVGVIEPGARAAVKASRSGKIGVIGTEATIGSGAYTRAIQALRPGLEIYTRACPLLVPLVEEGWTDNEIAERTVAHYLESLKASGIDTLLLGCTHYPLLRALFERVLGTRVRIIDSATSTASAVRERLSVLHIARRGGGGRQSFFVTETPDRFVRVGRRFLGPQVESAVRIER
ncbi:MAG TPA: glutamate racemase [Candidatus Binataceae bacterium]|jgi:glutamate racemase|nr:glutamate racemase [Candidatus Binataceae bacterium]